VIAHHNVGVCLGLSHQLFAGVIERARAAAFFWGVIKIGGDLVPLRHQPAVVSGGAKVVLPDKTPDHHLA
jgi:hypothetical protein